MSVSETRILNLTLRQGIVQLGPSSTSRAKLRYGPKIITKVAFNPTTANFSRSAKVFVGGGETNLAAGQNFSFPLIFIQIVYIHNSQN